MKATKRMYEGRTASNIWDTWNGNQREIFLSDHLAGWESQSYEIRSGITDVKYNNLSVDIQENICYHMANDYLNLNKKTNNQIELFN